MVLMKRSKGQIFLIIALILVIILVLLRQGFNVLTLIENKKFLESGLDRKELTNIENGIVKTVILSLDKRIGVVDSNTRGFTTFVQDQESRKTYDLTAFFVHASYPTALINTNTTLNITVFNGMKERITNLNLSFSYDLNSNKSFVVEDGTTLTTSYSFSTAVDSNYTLTLIRTTSTRNFTDSVQVPVIIGKTKYVGFFDLKLSTIRGVNRDSFTVTYDIP